jgi:DNA segregation ATPase FtsK/SpoIIIE-like protein
MLYLPPGTALPERVHGAFVSDEEVHRVVEHLKQVGGGPDYIEGVLDEVQTLGDGVVVGATGLPESGGGAGDESDPAVRRSRPHRHRNAPRIDFRRAASPEDRLQPRRAS